MKNLFLEKIVTVDGVKIFNSTPHAINFLSDSGEVIEVSASGHLINATPKEEVVSKANGVEFVRTVFEGNPEGKALIADIKEADPEVVIVGSIIAAQAFPGDVVAMTPAKGFERVAPAEKRMNPHKFTVFANAKEVQ